MNYEFLLLEKEDGIATITLNRPERLNALIPQMRVEMRGALEDVAADEAIRVVILTGAGRGFCSGADVVTVAERTEMAEDEPQRALELVYTNDIIDAKEMERIGLVNRVVSHDDLMKAAKEMAKKMLQIPPLTLALAKQCIYKGGAALDIESQMVFDNLVGRTLAQTEDEREAQRSFIEKREPVYRGK